MIKSYLKVEKLYKTELYEKYMLIKIEYTVILKTF